MEMKGEPRPTTVFSGHSMNCGFIVISMVEQSLGKGQHFVSLEVFSAEVFQ